MKKGKENIEREKKKKRVGSGFIKGNGKKGEKGEEKKGFSTAT